MRKEEGALPAAHVERMLQWGRNLIVAEGEAEAKYGKVRPKLQWGRNLIVAEGQLHIEMTKIAAEASMGPQLDSCGRLDHLGSFGPRKRFNGAAT